MPINTSPNMSLPVPVVGQEGGPQWSIDINNCLAILDQHTHSSGSGVQITPSGLNINSDLSMQSNNLTLARSIRFASQLTALAGASDKDCLYDVNGDLYFNNSAGTPIRITQSGAVAGTPGSIANLVSPASATYVAAQNKFVWEYNTNRAADMDFASATLRNPTAFSEGLTLAPPNAMAVSYQITLPPLPAAESVMTMQTSGNMTFQPMSRLLPAGIIAPYGGTTAPDGWLFCNGASVLRSQYPDLFTAIGTTWGAVDGTHFNVPNLINRSLRGAGAATDGNGGTTVNLGEYQGDAIIQHTHSGGTSVDSPDHVHTFAVSPDDDSPGGLAKQAEGAASGAVSTSGASARHTHTFTTDNGTPTTTETRTKAYGVNFIIKT